MSSKHNDRTRTKERENMKAKEFCVWLEGFFHGKTVTGDLATIKTKLDSVKKGKKRGKVDNLTSNIKGTTFDMGGSK